MSDPRIGTRLGQYLITDVIAQGGMAVVYKGYQETLDRTVAIKVMGESADRQFAERFKREARAMAALQHPNILPIYDYGEGDNILFLALQYIDQGRSLRDIVGTPMPPASALPLIRRVCNALDYAHKRGIIHRDIKPGNILLPSDTWPMLADFGIAKLINENQARITMANQVIGTAAYMAPEQATGRPIDARTDLYAVGAVLYELVTGQVPFDADTPMAVLVKHIYNELPSPRSIQPDIPESVEAVIQRALAKDPAQRYQSAADMAEALEQASNQLTLQAQRAQHNTLYETGVDAFKNAQWDAAIVYFDQLIAVDPLYADAQALRNAALAARQSTTSPHQLGATTTPQPQEQAASSSATATDGLNVQPVIPVAAGKQPITRTAEVSHSVPAVPAVPAAPVPPGSPRRNTMLLPLAIGAVALLGLLGVLAWQFRRPPNTVAISATTASNAPPTSVAIQAASPTTATAAPAPTIPAANMPPPLGQLVNTDDFNDLSRLDPNGLADLRGAKDFERGFHAPGVFHMKLPNNNQTQAVLMPSQIYTNFSVQITLWDNSDSEAGSVSQGMVFRAADLNHYYALIIDPRAGAYSLRAQQGTDKISELIPWTPSALINQGKEKNTLRIDANQHTLTFYLNGSQLGTYDDSTYSLGMIGMIVANIDAVTPHMHFDDLQIWSTDQPAKASANPAERKDPNGDMQLIAGGEFVIGSNFNPHEPPQMLTLPDFYIDRYEVTNARYRACVAAKACTPLSTNASPRHPEYGTQAEFDQYPVINVTWQQASTFCGWAGKRLPTEAEWEKAASWDAAKHAKTVWPWSGDFNSTLLNSDEGGAGDAMKVGTYPAELNGTFDMAGNVREWTSSLYQPYPYDPNDGREQQTGDGERVFRGGSWAQTAGKARAFARDEGAPPNVPFYEVGFRCAANP